MTEQKNEQHGAIVSVAALSVALLMYTTSMTTPALGEISKAFPEASPEKIKLLSSIPSLMMVVFSLVSGYVTRYISIKKVLYIAMALLFAGGIVPAFYGGINFILGTRFVFGVGYGLVFPLASAVVIDLFEGSRKNKLMGYRSAVGAAAGVVFQTMGGVLAMYHWRYAFLGFFLVIPIALLIHFKLPETAVKAAPGGIAGQPKEKKLTAWTYIYAVVCALMNLVQFTFMTNVAVVIQADGIGDAVMAANVLSTFTGAAFVTGLLYGHIARILKRMDIAFASACVGVSFVMLISAHTYVMFLAAACVFGVGFGTYNPSIAIRAAASATQRQYAPLAISLYVSGTGVGQFLSPYATKLARQVFQLTTPRADWIIAAVSILTGTVIAAVIILATKKQTAAA